MKRLLDRLTRIEPERRRVAAVWLLVVSFILAHANMVAFTLGLVPPALMDAITNYISWIALTLTAFDLLATTDVRAEQE